MNIIELADISKTYYMGAMALPVLHDISLTIEAGEFVVIMGHSGSGKSTLLHLLGLLDKPTGGTYHLSGRDISGLADDDLAVLRNHFIGYVFQQFNLLPRMSAKENVALPKIYVADKISTVTADEIALLARVGLADRVMHKPNELSGGQQQRVAIARALVNHPLLIFADEPTGNLDSKSTAEIIKILQELNKSGITIIMVTHEPDLAGAASRIIKLQDGAIISDTKTTPTDANTRAKTDTGTITHPNAVSVLNIHRVKDYFVQALRALMSNKTRSILSILGVLIGVSSLIAMMALGTGAQEQVKKSISSLGSNLLMVRAGSLSHGGVSMESGAVTRFTPQDAEEIRERIAGIERVGAYVSGRGQALANGKNCNTMIEGTTADYPLIRNAVPAQGRFFTSQEVTTRAKVAVLGMTVVKNLFGAETPLGQYIKIKRIDFKVIGVYKEKGSSGWRDEDDKISVPLNTAMYRLLGKEYIDSMDVQVAQADRMDEISDQIRNLLTTLHRLPLSQRDTIDVRNMADIQEAISSTTKAFSYLLGSIAFISLLVGGIGIMNIMLVSVSERTREIGLRKAIGANNKDILFQFMIESVVICTLGGVIGILFGAGISVLLAKLAGWSTQVSLFSVLLAFGFSVMIGLVFGIWPARKAAQLNPIDALRYE